MRLKEVDYDILSEIQLKGDISVKHLAEKVEVPVHVAHYALSRLRERGIIAPFPFVNVYPLGLEQYGLFFSLSGGIELRRRIVKYLVDSPCVSWVLYLGGDLQYGIGVCAHSSGETMRFLTSLSERFGDVFYEKQLSVRTQCTLFRRRYLSRRLHRQETLKYGDTGTQISIDSLDHLLLRVLTNVPASSNRDIGRFLGVSHTTVRNRIAGLRERGVLPGMATGIDSTKLGMHPYRLLLFFSKVGAGLRDELFIFAAQNPNIFAVMECLGSWDFELKVEVDSPGSLTSLLDAVYERFGSIVRTIKVLSVLGTAKLAFYPLRDPPRTAIDTGERLAIKLPANVQHAWD